MIETARLLLRPWREGDVAALWAMGQDADVMAHLGPLLTHTAARAQVEGQMATLAEHGFCFWALEDRGSGAFLGRCGLQPGPAGTPIAGEVEIGWALARPYWGQGYAREAAQAALAWGWANTRAPRIAAITTPGNARSWGLMERLGMSRVADGDFDHPALAEGDPLRRHVTYRIARPR